jgi:DNA gyrase inhibitor GyrI
MSEIMDIEAGLVTDSVPDDHPQIKPGLLPGGRYASLTYRGNGLRGNQALMQWARDTGNVFEPIDPALRESYVSRYEAYLTDYRVEPRKLLWDVELSIRVAN